MKYLWKTKKVFLLTVLLMVGIVGTATTFALLTSATGAVVNRFSVGDVNTHIEEEFEGTVSAGATVKKNPAIVNDGPSAAFIRARVTISPVTDLELLYGDWTEGTFTSANSKLEKSSDVNSHKWSYNETDGFYYYHVVTAPDTDYEVTETLFDAVKIGSQVTQNFDITIYQEAVFAEGYEAGTEVTTEAMVTAFESVNK